jgi:hypothetical protein
MGYYPGQSRSEEEEQRALRESVFEKTISRMIPASLSDLGGVPHLPSLLANAANQQSGSEEGREADSLPGPSFVPSRKWLLANRSVDIAPSLVGDIAPSLVGDKQRFSEPARQTHFTDSGLGVRHEGLSARGVDPSEYAALQRNTPPSLDEMTTQMADRPIERKGSLDDLIPGSSVKWGSREGMTTYGGPRRSLSDLEGMAHVRDIARSEHQARLADIGPDPYDARQKDIADARKQEQEYQESQPASNDELNRLGLSGDYTRGQIKKITGARVAQEAAIMAQRAAHPPPPMEPPKEMSFAEARARTVENHANTIAMLLRKIPRQNHGAFIREYIQQEAPQYERELTSSFFSTRADAKDAKDAMDAMDARDAMDAIDEAVPSVAP